MFCKTCGKQLGSDDKFCANCGTKVPVEKAKSVDLEPMFFVEKREEPVVEKKPKRVIHLDEFNWDLDGYPTERRKTEAVNFDWGSVLEDRKRETSPKQKEERVEKAEAPEVKAEPLKDLPKTVEELLAVLPDDVLEMVPDVSEEAEAADEPMEEAAEAEGTEPSVEDEASETVEVSEEKPETKEVEVKSLEQIMDDFGDAPLEEPTRLIHKSQMKTDSVDQFYMFSRRQAEYQNLLDLEYDRLQTRLQKKEAEAVSTPTIEEILAGKDAAPVKEPAPAAEAESVPTVEKDEQPAAVPVAETKPLELVAVVWSMPPAGIMVEGETKEEKKPAGKDTLMQEAKALMGELEKLMPEGVEATPSEDTAVAPNPEESAEPSEEEKEPTKESLTFADIFNDEDEDDEEEQKGGGCLKAIAVLLIIMVIIELGILGIQYFAKDSQAAKLINQTYGKIVGMITGSAGQEEEIPVEEAPAEPSEVEMLITAQLSKNENIKEIVENKALVFEAGKDYGYEELAEAYAFKNSPWYETEDGKEVTYGDEIIGAMLQYYSALPDKMNDVNKDVLDYVDNTTALYEELEAIEGDETRGYAINRLEIGEIKTGQKGFYVIVNVTSAEKQQPEEMQQKQLVYLEADPNEKMIKIKETKNI